MSRIALACHNVTTHDRERGRMAFFVCALNLEEFAAYGMKRKIMEYIHVFADFYIFIVVVLLSNSNKKNVNLPQRAFSVLHK